MQISVGDVLTLKIEKLTNLGLGMARPEGFVVFVENSCPEDVIKAEIIKKNKHYATAKILELINPSPMRTEVFCKMQKICGACQLQYISYDAQLKYKREIVQDLLKGLSVEVRDVIPSPDIKEYRHKIQYPIGQTKNSKRILAGYYKTGTHDIVNIKYCPIQPSYCDDIIEFIRNNTVKCGISGYDENSHKGELRHVLIRTSSLNQKSLVVLVVNADFASKGIIKLGNDIYENLKNISGVIVNFNNKKTNLILGEKSKTIIGNNYIEEILCDKIFKVGAKTFFQVNPKSADNIFRYIKNYISSEFKKPVILDAYAGITAFGICLSDIAEKIVSVEEVNDSVELAENIIKENEIKNIEIHCSDAGKFFSKEVLLGRQFNITVLDPPRKGCTTTSLDYALKLTKDKIIYVSCNPATLARDLKYLTEHGAKIESVQPFDMFPHTYHIENVAILDVQKL